MKLTPRLQRAINIAARQHEGQKRKGIAHPYIIHPISVALIVAEYLSDEDAVIAALFHDILEDTKGYNADAMRSDFGPLVTKLVEELSEDKSLPWRERKENHLKALAEASETALIITAADKIHNLASFAEVWGGEDENAKQGLRNMAQNSLWYFENMRDIIEKRLPNHPIRLRVTEAYNIARPFFISNQLL